MRKFYCLLTSVLMAAIPTSRVLANSLTQPTLPIPEGWSQQDDHLECTYELANFVEAVAFVEQLIDPAEALGHHPDVVIRYNQVSLSLTTHDADGLTDLDLALADEIVAIATHQDPPLSCLASDH